MCSLAKAKYDNLAESHDELAFRKGDVLTVIDQVCLLITTVLAYNLSSRAFLSFWVHLHIIEVHIYKFLKFVLQTSSTKNMFSVIMCLVMAFPCLTSLSSGLCGLIMCH